MRRSALTNLPKEKSFQIRKLFFIATKICKEIINNE